MLREPSATAALLLAVAGCWSLSAALPTSSQHLPAEHRLPSADLVLPDTAGIPGQRLGEWQVDKFFSLWYIFAFSDNVEVSKEPYTVLAPSNAAFERVKLEPGFSGREHIIRVLRNHILLGQLVTGERLKQLADGQQLQLPTLLGTTAVFTSRAGQLYVNDTAIIGDVLEIDNASIIRTADYLPLPAAKQSLAEPQPTSLPLDGSGNTEDNDLDTSESVSSLPLINVVEDIDVGQEFSQEGSADSPAHEFATDNQRLRIPAAGKESFLEAVEDALNLLKSGVGEFQGYFYDANITSVFSKDKEYTLFLPVNEAFQRFYPIDWGFNPFLVKDFTRQTILNHFVPGKLTSGGISDGQRAKTLGGKELVFRTMPDGLEVNGHHVFLGDTPISHGNILFLDEVLFVDYDIIADLRKQHRDKETAPVLAGMAGEAAFLAHLIVQLVHRDGGASYGRFAEYLTRGFADIVKHAPNYEMYTFLAVDDASVAAALGVDPDRELLVSDPLLADASLRTRMLLEHLVPERLYLRQLRHGQTITTAAGNTLRVTQKDGETYLNGARLLPREEHVYNLGNLLFVDSFPLLSDAELRRRAALLPPFEGSGAGSGLLPLSVGLEGVESFAGEDGVPEGMIREDGVFEEDDLMDVSVGRRDV